MATHAGTMAGSGDLPVLDEEAALVVLRRLCEEDLASAVALAKRVLEQAALLGTGTGMELPTVSADTLGELLVGILADARTLARQLAGCAAWLSQTQTALASQLALAHDMRRGLVRWIAMRFGGEPSALETALLAAQHLCDRVTDALVDAYVAQRNRQSQLDRAQAGEALGWFERLSESGLLGMLVCDVHGGIKDANATFAEMVGYTRAELTSGQVRWSEMTPPEWAALDREAVRQLAETGKTRTWEKEYYRRDGSRVPVLVGVASLAGDDVVAFTLDITERKSSEELRVRSIALENENRRIQEASRLKSEFLANMSHELRTPLNSIIGFADLLYDREIPPDSPQHHEFLGDILKSGRHLLQLINDVLDLAKIEAGKMDFRPEPVQLKRLCGEVLDVMRSVSRTNKIAIQCVIEDDVNDIVTDPARLKQVLYNFLSNAIKFTSAGGTVTVRAVSATDDDLKIEVEDTGVGIAERDLDRLFVEFEQLDHGSTKKHAGTGLGLALTLRIVEAQGGSVGVRSSLGKGSTFWAILPKHSAAPQVEMPGLLPERYDDAPLVLIVEDDPQDQQFLARTLNDANYGVELAATGQRAMEACRARAFDAITLDLLLPDVSGLQVLRQIRREGLNRETPVIVVSVVAEREVMQGYTVTDYITKPVESSMLLGSLERAGLGGKNSGSILVVDDDPSSLKLMRTTLAKLGYEVDCQLDAARALACVDPRRHAAVILDLLMPGMDGFEFLRRFRADALYRDIPVIVWTTKDLTAEDRHRLKRHVQAVHEKGAGRPFSLVETLATLLGGRPLRQEGAVS